MFYNLKNNLRKLYTTKDVPQLTKELNKLLNDTNKALTERVVKSWIMPSAKSKPTLDNLDLLCKYFEMTFNELIY